MSHSLSTGRTGARRRPARTAPAGTVLARSARAAAAALAAGVVVMVPARAFMRLVALAVGEDHHFSWVGSLGIAVVFAVAMLPGALLAALYAGPRRWVLCALGAVLLLVPATGIARDEVGPTGLHGPHVAGVLAAGAAVYLCIAALPVLTLRLVGRRP